MNLKVIRAGVVIACLCGAAALPGQIVEWKAHGTVQSLFSSGTPPVWTSAISKGDSFDLSFQVDLSATPFFDFPPTQIYYTHLGQAQVGTLSFTFADPQRLTVFDDGTPSQAYFFQGDVLATGISVGLSLSSSSTNLDGLGLPTSLPPLSDFDVVHDLMISYSSVNDRWQAYAPLDSVTITPLGSSAVPEPSTYGLVGVLALIGVAFRKRYQRS